MPKASELKRGSVVEINGDPYIVVNIDMKAPSSRGANTLYKVRFNNARTKQKLDETYKGEDMLGAIDMEKDGGARYDQERQRHPQGNRLPDDQDGGGFQGPILT